MPAIIEKLRFFARLARYELSFGWKARPSTALPARDSQLLAQIREQGIGLVEGFLNTQEAEALSGQIYQLVADPSTNLWIDRVGSDHRVYGANEINELIESHFANSWIRSVATQYQKRPVISGFTLAAQMLYKEGSLGSGNGWHRDSGDRHQIKSITYLSDVTPGEGPFQYISRSHTFVGIFHDWLFYGLSPWQIRYENSQVEKLIKREPGRLMEVTGKAGTLLFADTRGIHRGKPMHRGERLALTNYYWFDSEIPEHIRPTLQSRK